MPERSSHAALIPDSPDREDVSNADLAITRQLVAFYAELIAFEEDVVASMLKAAQGFTPEVRAAEEESDLIPIRNDVALLHLRRAAWQRHQQELER